MYFAPALVRVASAAIELVALPVAALHKHRYVSDR